MHITLKCKKADYLLYFTKQWDLTKEDCSPFVRCNHHQIFVQNIQIKIERLEKTINQALFFDKNNCNVNYICPLHSKEWDNISSEIKNKQQEVTIQIQRDFLNNQSGKIVYQDKEFTFLYSKEFRENILYDIVDAKKGFDVEDEFISTTDMILKVNLNENRIHVWSMNPQFEYQSFIRTLMEIKDNKEKLLQEIILQQYSLDNQTVYGDNYDMNDG